MDLLERLKSKGPKRILSLDGGGIRGAITVGFLEQIEKVLRDRSGNQSLKLCDYFDLIGGTSTGAIIASALAIGMEASEIKEMYLKLGGKIFGMKRSWFKRLNATFDKRPLEKELKRLFKDKTIGDSSIKTGLCIVTKRADTGSTWPLINHPEGMFYQDNSPILLRRAVRASTAAPTYFIPEKFDVGQGQIGAFVDGGVSMANNPALQLFLVATLKGFHFHWPSGKDNLLLVSVGTGAWKRNDNVDDVVKGKLWDWAKQVPSMLMEDASWHNQLILQYLSSTPTPWEIDSEIGDLSSDLLLSEPALHYLRYNVPLEKNELDKLGFTDVNVESLREMSEAKNRDVLVKIGKKAAEQQVLDEHFPKSFD